MRLFIAIPIDDKTRLEVCRMCDYLKERVSDVRWVKAENLHITMKFLGDTKEKLVPEISSAMEEVSKYLPFEMEIGGIGGFPSLASARVIWVGAYDESQTVHRIYEEIETGIGNLGFKKEKRKYSPHITVGRSKRKPVRVDVGHELGKRAGSTLIVNEVVLYKSDLKSSGAEYTVLERVAGHGS